MKDNILVVTYWSYNDALIQTYTLPYVEIILKNISNESKVFLVTLDQEEGKNRLSNSKFVNVSFKYKKFGLLGFLMWIKVIFRLMLLIKKENITTIHTWCTPAGAIGYILSILTGKKLIIDSFEPHALPMIEGNTWKKNNLAFKILFWFEKKQLKRAEEVICAVDGMIEHSKKIYGVSKKRYFVKPACVNLAMFSKSKLKNEQLLNELNLKNSITCVYAGKFGGLYLENEIFDFFKIAINYWEDKFRILLLTSHTDEEISKYLLQSEIDSRYLIKRFIPHHSVAEYIGLADFAICPMKPLPSRRYGTPIKNGEYWALGLPVVITKGISDDSSIIKENKIGSVLEDLTPQSYLNSIKEIDSLLKNNTRDELYLKIRPIAEKYRNFRIANNIYKEIYSN